MTLADLLRESHTTAVQKGWWVDDRGFAECIALCHSELSEALEEYRDWAEFKGNFYHAATGKPCGIAVELADVLIRIADMCGRWNIPLAEALEAKLAYNLTRPHRHGGKKC